MLKREGFSHKLERANHARECKTRLNKSRQGQNKYLVVIEYLNPFSSLDIKQQRTCFTVWAIDEPTARDKALQNQNLAGYTNLKILEVEHIK